MVSWLTSSRAGWIATVVVATQLFFHSLVQPFTWAANPKGIRGISLAKVAHDLLRVIVEAALLPYQAWQTLDAIVRVWYRRAVSHRGLLEWASAQVIQAKAQFSMPMFVLSMVLASLFCAVVGGAVASPGGRQISGWPVPGSCYGSCPR